MSKESLDLLKDIVTQVIYPPTQDGEDEPNDTDRSIMTFFKQKRNIDTNVQTGGFQMKDVSLSLFPGIDRFASAKSESFMFLGFIPTKRIVLNREKESLLKYLEFNQFGMYELRIPNGVSVSVTINDMRISFKATLVAAFTITQEQASNKVNVNIPVVAICGVDELQCYGNTDRCAALETLLPYALSIIVNVPIALNISFPLQVSDDGVMKQLLPFFVTSDSGNTPRLNNQITCGPGYNVQSLTSMLCRTIQDRRIMQLYGSIDDLFPDLISLLWNYLSQGVTVGVDRPAAERTGLEPITRHTLCDRMRQNCNRDGCVTRDILLDSDKIDLCKAKFPGDVSRTSPELAARYPDVFTPGQTIERVYKKATSEPKQRTTPCKGQLVPDRPSCTACPTTIKEPDKTFCDQFLKFEEAHCKRGEHCHFYKYKHSGIGIRINTIHNLAGALMGSSVESVSQFSQRFRTMINRAKICCLDDQDTCTTAKQSCIYNTSRCAAYLCSNPNVAMSLCTIPLMFVASNLIEQLADFSSILSTLQDAFSPEFLSSLPGFPRTTYTVSSLRANIDRNLVRVVKTALTRFDRYQLVSCDSSSGQLEYLIPVDTTPECNTTHFLLDAIFEPGVNCAVRNGITLNTTAHSRSEVVVSASVNQMRLRISLLPECRTSDGACCQVGNVTLSTVISDLCVSIPRTYSSSTFRSGAGQMVTRGSWLNNISMCQKRQVGGQHVLRRLVSQQDPLSVISMVLSNDPSLLPYRTMYMNTYQVSLPVDNTQPQYAYLDDPSHLRLKVPFAYHIVGLGRNNPLVGKGMRIKDPFEIQMAFTCASNGAGNTCTALSRVNVKLQSPDSLRFDLEDEYKKIQDDLARIRLQLPDIPPDLLSSLKTLIYNKINEGISSVIAKLPVVCA